MNISDVFIKYLRNLHLYLAFVLRSLITSNAIPNSFAYNDREDESPARASSSAGSENLDSTLIQRSISVRSAVNSRKHGHAFLPAEGPQKCKWNK